MNTDEGFDVLLMERAWREIRLKLGLTQAQIARRLGVSLRHYGAIERGDREAPLLFRLAVRALADVIVRSRAEAELVLRGRWNGGNHA